MEKLQTVAKQAQEMREHVSRVLELMNQGNPQEWKPILEHFQMLTGRTARVHRELHHDAALHHVVAVPHQFEPMHVEHIPELIRTKTLPEMDAEDNEALREYEQVLQPQEERHHAVAVQEVTRIAHAYNKAVRGINLRQLREQPAYKKLVDEYKSKQSRLIEDKFRVTHPQHGLSMGSLQTAPLHERIDALFTSISSGTGLAPSQPPQRRPRKRKRRRAELSSVASSTSSSSSSSSSTSSSSSSGNNSSSSSATASSSSAPVNTDPHELMREALQTKGALMHKLDRKQQMTVKLLLTDEVVKKKVAQTDVVPAIIGLLEWPRLVILYCVRTNQPCTSQAVINNGRITVHELTHATADLLVDKNLNEKSLPMLFDNNTTFIAAVHNQRNIRTQQRSVAHTGQNQAQSDAKRQRVE